MPKNSWLERNQVQRNWGRIQQQGEQEYRPVVDRNDRPTPPASAGGQTGRSVREVLETFKGYVEQIVDGIAYVTLKPETGPDLTGQIHASELQEKGIRESRSFFCRTIRLANGSIQIELEAIPDQPLSAEEKQAIDEQIRLALEEDDAPCDGD